VPTATKDNKKKDKDANAPVETSDDDGAPLWMPNLFLQDRQAFPHAWTFHAGNLGCDLFWYMTSYSFD